MPRDNVLEGAACCRLNGGQDRPVPRVMNEMIFIFYRQWLMSLHPQSAESNADNWYLFSFGLGDVEEG